MKKIVVCGAGTMGGGIAQVCANAGYEVWMYDLTDAFAQGGKNKIAAGLEKQVSRGKITEEAKQALLDRLHPTSDIGCAADADLIMEAVLEDIQVKKDLFAKLEAVCRDDAIIGTNTSYIPQHAGSRYEASRAVPGYALLQPCVCHEAAGSHPW